MKLKKQILISLMFGLILTGNVHAQWTDVVGGSGIQYTRGMVYLGPVSDFLVASGRLSVSGGNAELSLLNRNLSTFVSNPGSGERWTIYNGGTASDGKLTFWTGGDKVVFTKEGRIGVGTSAPSGLLSFGTQTQARTLALYDAPTDWYGLGIQSFQMRFQVGTTNARYSFYAGDNTELMTINGNGSVGIGGNDSRFKLNVEGIIRASEVTVCVQNGCDFVFDRDYKLMDLNSLEKFVKTNQHLPEIASEKEMIEEGVNMKELQMKLLQKVEELTLYTIEQNKKIVALESQTGAIEELKQLVRQQSEKIAELEATSKRKR